jgi:tetratricopeptide (TPR) repeat protein
MRIALVFAALLLASSAEAATPPPFAGADVPAAEKQLDALFASLAKAGSAEEAQPVEQQILGLFLLSGSPSIDLLMNRAAEALQSGDVGTAKRLFDSVTDIAPGYAEGWHQRGRLEAVAGNDKGAIESLERAVALNPRQFQALAELGGMLEEYGDKPGALEVYKKAAALDPNLDEVAGHVRELSRTVEGQGI